MAMWSSTLEKHIDINDLKARCDLRTIIPPYLKKAKPIAGGEYWCGCCPFHDDNNPSFLVYPHYYRCKSESCGEWGSVIDWFSHLYPNMSLKELLRLIDNDCGHGLPIPMKPIRIPTPKTEPLPTPLIIEEVRRKYQLEYPSDDIMNWIHDKWCLSEQAVRVERITYSMNQKALAIPVWGDNSNLITVRFRNYDNPKMGKYWGIPGRNEVYGYGRQWLRGADRAIVVMGELTACFLHHEWGFASFSWTNGCKSFRPYLADLLSGLAGGVIVPDVGEDDAAAHIAHQLGNEWTIALLEDVGGQNSEDVIDWAKRAGSRDEFCKLIMNGHTLTDGILPYWGSRLSPQWKR